MPQELIFQRTGIPNPNTTSTSWDAVTDPLGHKPQNNAVNTSLSNAPFGSGTVGSTLSAIATAESNIAGAQTDIYNIQHDQSNNAAIAVAAASAAAAARDASVAAQNNAQTARDQSQAARDAAQAAQVLAQSASTAAGNASVNAAAQSAAAGSARDAAQAARDAALASSIAAGGSASAAAGSASTSQSSADAAAGSASVSSAQATIATTKAADASTYSTNAATSATNAAGSSSSAATSAGVAASAKAGALSAADAASTSASAAAASNTAAGQQAAASQHSALNAATSAGQASVFQGQAATSASSAAGSANTASQQAGLAATARDVAGSSADAAAGSASYAAGQASAAGSSATSATGSANTAIAYAGAATSSAGNSASSASAAAASASSAVGQANAAGLSASSAQQSSLSAKLGTSRTFPSGFTPSEHQFWTEDEQNPDVAGLVAYSDNHFGPASYPVFASDPNTYNVLATRGNFVPVVGRHYRVTINIATAVATSNDKISMGYHGFVLGQSDGTFSYNCGAVNLNTIPGGFNDITYEWVCSGFYAWARPRFHINSNNVDDGNPAYSSNASYHIKAFLFEDITAQRASEAAAGASASSASTASASQTSAGNSAAAALQSEQNAYTSYQSSAERAGAASYYAGQASNSASQASTSASNASGSANSASSSASQSASSRDTAGSSAAASQSSANYSSSRATDSNNSASTAQYYAGVASSESQNANNYAGASSASAAAASSYAAAASSSAALSATAGPGYINKNAIFSQWSNANVAPDYWDNWDYSGGTPQRVAGVNGRPYALQFNAAANQNTGVVTYGTLGFGAFVVEVAGRATNWQGTGCLVQFCNADRNVGLYSMTINCSTDPDISGYVSRDGGGGNYTRTWSKYFATGINGDVRTFNIYAMASWDGFGDRYAKTVQFDRVSIRPASASEIAAQRADQNATTALAQITYQAGVAASDTAAVASTASGLRTDLNGLSATVSQQAGTLSTIDGKTQAYVNITAQAGGNTAYVGIFANNGQGGLTSGVILGGNVYIDGNLTLAGTIQTGAAATNAFGTSWLAANPNTVYGAGLGAGNFTYDDETGEKVYNDNTVDQQIVSITIGLPYTADIVATYTTSMDMPNGSRSWRFTLNDDLGGVTKAGGAFLDTPVIRLPRIRRAAGYHTFTLNFAGQNNGVYVSNGVLTIEARYNYGSALS